MINYSSFGNLLSECEIRFVWTSIIHSEMNGKYFDEFICKNRQFVRVDNFMICCQ